MVRDAGRQAAVQPKKASRSRATHHGRVHGVLGAFGFPLPMCFPPSGRDHCPLLVRAGWGAFGSAAEPDSPQLHHRGCPQTGTGARPDQ